MHRKSTQRKAGKGSNPGERVRFDGSIARNCIKLDGSIASEWSMAKHAFNERREFLLKKIKADREILNRQNIKNRTPMMIF